MKRNKNAKQVAGAEHNARTDCAASPSHADGSASTKRPVGSWDETAGKVAIYALCDTHGVVRYVGKSKNPAARMKRHVREAINFRGVNRHKEAWIRAMQMDGEHVHLRVLEWCGDADWEAAERRYITQYADTVTNQAPGGNQPICSLKTRRDNAKRLHEHPEYPLMVAIRVLSTYARTALRAGNSEVANKLLLAVMVLRESKGNARIRLLRWAEERFKHEASTNKAA